MDEHKAQLQAFLDELTALSQKHGVVLYRGCECPTPIMVEPVAPEYTRGHYTLLDGRCLDWQEDER